MSGLLPLSHLLPIFLMQAFHTAGLEIEVKKQQAVFLHCSFRTGSSLLGELFNNNPNSFYVFEPLIGAPPERYTHVRDHFRSLSNCSNCSVNLKTCSILLKLKLYHYQYVQILGIVTVGDTVDGTVPCS